jgi:hypothetical protein
MSDLDGGINFPVFGLESLDGEGTTQIKTGMEDIDSEILERKRTRRVQ